MKFDVIEREVQSVGALSTKSITLSANAKAFKIIFGQIYPDIIKAIVRELFTNAWDSQKVAGTLDTPIDIHLPTTFEPWFSIRDYGTGMTPQVVDDIYSVVFESSKDDSNEEAGMFGMGSKTPLGYTDGFTVTSYVDGKLYAYDIFIGSGGNPQISLNAVEDTDEPNGVEVSVAVQTGDFDKFKTHAELFAIHAGTPININRQRFLNKRKELTSGDGWVLFEPNHDIASGAYIRMGCVLYHIDSTMILDGMSYSGWYERQNIIRKYDLPLIVDFDIGDFEVTGSREDIIYNQDSIKRIDDRLTEVYDLVINYISDLVKNQRSFADSVNLIRKFREIDNVLTNSNDYQYGSMPINKIINRYNNASAFKLDMMHARYSVRGNQRVANFSNCFDMHLFLSDSIVTYIIIDDGNTMRAPSRVQNLVNILNSKRMGKSYNGNPRVNNDIAFSYLWIKTDDVTKLKRLAPFLPKHYQIVNIADIDPLPPVKRVPREKKTIDTAYSLRHSYRLDRPAFSEAHDPVSEMTYYLKIDRRNFDDNIADIKHAMNVLDISEGQVALIDKKKEEFIEKYDLVNLLVAAKIEQDKIDYNFSTYYYYAVRKIKDSDEDKIDSKWYSYPTNELVNHVIGMPIIFADVDSSFYAEMNDHVKERFRLTYDEVVTKIENFIDKHPIINYVDNYNFIYNSSEILKALGEMK